MDPSHVQPFGLDQQPDHVKAGHLAEADRETHNTRVPLHGLEQNGEALVPNRPQSAGEAERSRGQFRRSTRSRNVGTKREQ